MVDVFEELNVESRLIFMADIQEVVGKWGLILVSRYLGQVNMMCLMSVVIDYCMRRV